MKGNGNIVFSVYSHESVYSQKQQRSDVQLSRETSVSRHHGGPIEGPPETPRISLNYRIEWYRTQLKLVEVFLSSINGNVFLAPQLGVRLICYNNSNLHFEIAK